MADGRSTHADQANPEWRVFRSSTGRCWATREKPFTDAQEQAGAARTVDADDEIGLAREIAEQESRAALAGAPIKAGEHGLSEFTGLWRDENGMLRATHIPSGRQARGETWEEIRLAALVIRVSEGLKRARS